MKRKHKAGKISRLRDGRYQIDCRNSKGNPTRPSFATKADAQAALVEITRQQHAGMHSADASKIRFAEAVEAWRAYERGRYARDEIGLARLGTLW